MFQIYALADPSTHKIRYVGHTRNAMRRWVQHISETPTGITTPKQEWIGNLIERGLSPVMVVLQECETKREAEELETRWIKSADGLGWNLTNSTRGRAAPMMETEIHQRITVGLFPIGKRALTPTEAQEVTRLHAEGMGINQLCRVVYGHKDGKAHRWIREALTK